MIAYEVLVQTIADWKAGVRPTAPTPPPAPVGAPEQVEEFSSGVVDLDDELSFSSEEEGEEEDQGAGEYGYDESEYQQPAQTYEDDDEG